MTGNYTCFTGIYIFFRLFTIRVDATTLQRWVKLVSYKMELTTSFPSGMCRCGGDIGHCHQFGRMVTA